MCYRPRTSEARLRLVLLVSERAKRAKLINFFKNPSNPNLSARAVGVVCYKSLVAFNVQINKPTLRVISAELILVHRIRLSSSV